MENKEFELNKEYYLADGTKVWARGMDFKGDIFITEQFHVSEGWYVGNHPDRLEWAEFDEDVPGRTYTIEKEYLFSEPPIALKNERITALNKEIKNLKAKIKSAEDQEKSITDNIAILSKEYEEKISSYSRKVDEAEQQCDAKLNVLKGLMANLCLMEKTAKEKKATEKGEDYIQISEAKKAEFLLDVDGLFYPMDDGISKVDAMVNILGMLEDRLSHISSVTPQQLDKYAKDFLDEVNLDIIRMGQDPSDYERDNYGIEYLFGFHPNDVKEMIEFLLDERLVETDNA